MERTIKIDRYYGSLRQMKLKYDRLARRDAFAGSTTQEYEIWKKQARSTLSRLLGLDKMEECPLPGSIGKSGTWAGNHPGKSIAAGRAGNLYARIYFNPAPKGRAETELFYCASGSSGGGKIQCGRVQ